MEPYSQPYWLVLPNDGELYSVPDPRMIGNPENRAGSRSTFSLQHRWSGNRNHASGRAPLYRSHLRRTVSPSGHRASGGVTIAERAIVFAYAAPRKIEVPSKRPREVSGDVDLDAPAGWHSNPPRAISNSPRSTTNHRVFHDHSSLLRRPRRTSRRRHRRQPQNLVAHRSDRVSAHPHADAVPPAEAQLVRADIRTLSRNIGYVMGAGDDEPDALRQIGCDVTLLSADDLTTRRSLALRRDRHRRPRLQHPRRPARELSAAVRLRRRTAAR